jgi:ubiquitin-like 1-activating enzyme E1 A
MNEVCKNLVLGGIGMLTVMDDHIVQDDDLKSQIFLRKGDVGLQRVDAAFERIQEMNPRVKLQKFVGKVVGGGGPRI